MRFIFYSLCLVFCLSVSLHGQELYWIDGPGEWTDPSHWSDQPGGSPVGVIPDGGITAIIEENSRLFSGDQLVLPPGTHQVQSFIVQTTEPFTLRFTGTSSASVIMEIFGDLQLSKEMNIQYDGTFSSHNRWRFNGNNSQKIKSSTQDLYSVEFFNPNGTYEQTDALLASGRIRMYGGTWNTISNDVTTEFLFFRDNNGSSNPLPKEFQAGASEIRVGEWDSRLVYGSLTVTGEHRIFTRIFSGNPPASVGGPGAEYNEIHLLPQPDGSFNGNSLIESNNFECLDCIIDRLIIEDTGETQLANSFTIEEELTIVNPGSTIQLNQGNGRNDFVIINGNVNTPPAQGCGDRTVFEAVYNSGDPFYIERAAGTLTVANATLRDLQTQGGATFNISNGTLEGSSSGWNIINPPSGLLYRWVGRAGQVTANWDDLDAWKLDDGGPVGCVPSRIDDVIFDNIAVSNVRIPSGYYALCNNFNWENENGLQLILNGAPNNSSKLEVNGNFTLESSANVTAATQFDGINFTGSGNNTIDAKFVNLPNLYFEGANTTWTLVSPLFCQEIVFAAGTLETDGNLVSTEDWRNSSSQPKTLGFSDSKITITNHFSHSAPGATNVTVTGTSLIECSTFESLDATLHDLRVNNPGSLTLISNAGLSSPFHLTLNRLLINGLGNVRTDGELTVNELVFERSEAALELSTLFGATINGGISSLVSGSPAPHLRSRQTGSQAEIMNAGSGICVSGPVAIQDIIAVVGGTFHAPEATDDGNNTDVNFSAGDPANVRYWRGRSGNFNVAANWSGVSGGCPVLGSPVNTPLLIVDDLGLGGAGQTITVNGTVATASELRFDNSEAVTLDVPGVLGVNLLTVAGEVDIQGFRLIVQQTVTVNNPGGHMRVANGDMRSDSLLNAGIIEILNEGSLIIDN